MSGDHLLHGYKPQPRQPLRQGEPLWTLTKDDVRVAAELMDQSSAGVELRMLRNGEWQSGRRFTERINAVAHAEQNRLGLVAKGWQPA
jgi:hypothetical protein